MNFKARMFDADHLPPAAVGGTFEFTRVAAANLREKDDHLNSALGGFASGAILGMQSAIWCPPDKTLRTPNVD
jgi:hypothetical protein